MPAVQTTYNTSMAAAVAGMIANSQNHDIDSCVVETAAGIGFGLAVGQGAAANGAVLGAAAATGFRGISVREITNDPSNGDIHPQYGDIPVITEGDIWVTTGGAVVAGNDVTFNKTTGVLSTVAADANNFAITGARWMTSAASGALAIVRLSGQLPTT